MATDSEAIDTGHDDVSYIGEGLCEECMEEYDLGEDQYTSSSTHVDVVEQIQQPDEVEKRIRSSSENISTLIPSFKSSCSLISTRSPRSWPSIITDDTYIDSSGAIDGVAYPGYDPSSSESTKESVISEIKPKVIAKPKPKSPPLELESPKKIKKSKCVKIPFLHDILRDELSSTPTTTVHFIEHLKVSIDNDKTMSENTVAMSGELALPESGFAGDLMLNVEDMVDCDGNFIESSSSFEDCGYTCGTKVFSKTAGDFLLVEEKRMEYQYNAIERREKSLHVFIGSDSNYIAYRTAKEDDHERKFRGCIALDWQSDFVQDGCIFAIMRHLILVNFTGCFQCYTVTITGRVCRQVFCIDGKQSMPVNGEILEVILLRKSTYDYDTKKKIEMSETCYLPNGRIIYHTWKYSPYIVHIDPMVLFQDKQLNPCMELTWKADCVLNTLFQFEKEYSHNLLQRYLDSYPEILELLNDYIIALFQEKPESIVEFTCNFFEHA